MNRGRTLALLCLGFVCLGWLAIAVGPATAQTLTSVTYEGAATELTAQQEQSSLAEMRELADRYPVETRDHAFVLENERGTWVVFTDSEPMAGRATVRGTEIPTSTGGVIFAESVAVDQRGTPTELDAVLSNPSAYEYNLVRLTTTVNSLSYTVEAGAESETVVDQQLAAAVGTQTTQELVGAPGLTSRAATRDLAQQDTRSREIVKRIGSDSETIGITRSQTRLWASSRVTIDALVFVDGGSVSLYIVDRRVAADREPSLGDLADSGAAMEGQVARTEANALGVRISTQETLLEAARCAPKSVVFPGVNCLPIPADAVVHAGVLYDGVPDGPTDVVFYSGLSNRVQQQPVTVERGRYEVAGRVTSAQALSPALPNATGLIAYELTRSGGSGAPPDAVESYSSSIESRMRQQIRSGEQAAVSTRTSTATPASSEGAQQTTQQAAGTAQIAVVDASVQPARIEAGQSVAIRITVENTGTAAGATTLDVQVGRISTAETVRVPAGETKTVTVGLQPEGTGEQTARVEGEAIDSVSVADRDGSLFPDLGIPVPAGLASLGWLLPGIALVVGATAYLGGWVYVLRRFECPQSEWTVTTNQVLAGAAILVGVGLVLALFAIDPPGWVFFGLAITVGVTAYIGGWVYVIKQSEWLQTVLTLSLRWVAAAIAVLAGLGLVLSVGAVEALVAVVGLGLVAGGIAVGYRLL